MDQQTRNKHFFLKRTPIPIFFGLWFFAFISAACTQTQELVRNSPSTPMFSLNSRTPRVSPYVKVNVESVEIRAIGRTSKQMELVIRGTLPDQCSYTFYSVENRNDQKVKISLDGVHPGKNGCAQTSQTVETILLLGRDLPAAERGFDPGHYSLIVNNYQTSFSIK